MFKLYVYMYIVKYIYVYVVLFFVYMYIYRMLNEDMREKEFKIFEMLRQNLKLLFQVKKKYYYNFCLMYFMVYCTILNFYIEICNCLKDQVILQVNLYIVDVFQLEYGVEKNKILQGNVEGYKKELVFLREKEKKLFIFVVKYE